MARQTVLGGDPPEDERSARRRDTPEPPDACEPASSEAPRAFQADGREFDEELRPQRLHQIVGQRKVVERVQIILDAAMTRGEPLGHLLLDGPPGLGKTTLATVIPRELGADLQMASGPALRAPKDLVPYLTRATERSVLFIDEIHRLPAAVEEYLYSAMEDFRVDIALGEGVNARTVNLKLKRFTVIGATTRSGMLTAPLRDRFVNRAHLDFYDEIDLIEIITRNADKLRSTIDADAAGELARRSRRTPRKANNLLRWARDYAQVKQPTGGISLTLTNAALQMLEIDALGLEEQDRRYLRTLQRVFGGGPAGLQAIGHSMNVPPDTLEDEVEPFLLQCGFVQRTPRGRMLTPDGLAHLGETDRPGRRDPQQRMFP